jgi:hypothetical protein
LTPEAPLQGSQPAQDQATSLHFYTYLLNAGLSEKDILEVGDELWRRVRERVAKMAMSADAEERLRYCGTGRVAAACRSRINKEIIAEEFLAMRFTLNELSRVDVGLRLGLSSADAKTGRTYANVTGIDGRPQRFEVITESLGPYTERVFLKDTRTGQTIQVDQ